MYELLAELVRSAVHESECVALFVIALVLIVVMHAQNTRKLDALNARQTEHERHCEGGKR